MNQVYTQLIPANSSSDEIQKIINESIDKASQLGQFESFNLYPYGEQLVCVCTYVTP